MGLLINQGKQDVTQDNKFNPVVADNVMMEITELKLADSTTAPNTLEVTLRILEGQYRNRFVFDRVQFAPSGGLDMTWKYRALRKCAGVPYDENEPATVDIEALLLHKAVLGDLGIRKGKNKDGEEQDYQNIKYKVIKGNVAQANATSATPTETAVDFDTPAPAPQEPTTPVTKAPAPAVAPTPTPSFNVEIPTTEELNVDDDPDWE